MFDPEERKCFKVKGFRPISLRTSLYKIIVKVLSVKLKKVLNNTIAETQCVFIEGRQILDLCLIANKVVGELRCKQKWVFKVDFEKANDKVDWSFLNFVQLQKEFGERWRKWIKGCVSTVSFSVLINGRPRGQFKGEKGPRQGDPLSLSCLIW